jgi:hypothetical protein
LHTSWQQKFFTKLLGLNYKIVYKKGSENKVVDALSRRPVGNDESIEIVVCMTLSKLKPLWLQEVAASYEYEGDIDIQEKIAKLAVDRGAMPNFVLSNGLLRYKIRIWVGQDS